jgi:hypothetical protein
VRKGSIFSKDSFVTAKTEMWAFLAPWRLSRVTGNPKVIVTDRTPADLEGYEAT